MGLIVQLSSAHATDMKISAGSSQVQVSQFKCRKGTSGVKCIKQHEDEGTGDDDRLSVNAANRIPVLQTVSFYASLSDIFLQSFILIYISIFFNCAIDEVYYSIH
jgi:hypothetical protein